MRKSLVLVAAPVIGLAFLLAAAPRSHAQSGGDDTVRFKITAGGKDLYKLGIPASLGPQQLGLEVSDIANNDLSLSGFFKVIDRTAYLANLQTEGLSINPSDWKNVGAEGVIKSRITQYGNDLKVEFRLYEIAKGDQPVLAKDYRGPASLLRTFVHQWDNEVVRYFTGEDGFFTSRIAFSAPTGPKRRDIFVMDWDGANLQQLTRASQNILPSWNPNGQEVAFTSYLKGNPDLYAVPLSGGSPRALSRRPGINMNAAFSPDGGKIATTLSQDGNSELYLLTAKGDVLKRLTNNPFIDSQPTWSPDGARLAFISDRHGSPQVWVMTSDGSNPQKVTRRGNYNQTPAWTPRKDAPVVAFTARDEKYNYDIFTVNIDTGEMTRITEGHGSNQRPSWAPNGRAVAYESSRGGIWISTADGRTERQVYKGSATAPAWGPALK
jgi:TolB protein